MVKNKKVLLISAVIAAIVIVAGGATVALVRKDKAPQQLSLLSGDAADPYSTKQSTSQQSADGAATAASGAAGSLNVSSSGGASQLGQIGGSQASQTTGSSNNGGSSSASSGAASAFDPATFAQYDKYKDATSAMFGDVIKGDGAELTDGKKAAVYYKGWLTNGTLFDQSRAGADGKLAPFTFQLGAHQVIPGWEQALTGMKVGGVRLVIVPASVGYGASGQGSIPPNSTLVFQVQLAAVQ